MRRRGAAALLLVGLLTGCGLPLESGVRSPGPVTGDAQEPGGMQTLPDGPQPDAGPRELVQGFLEAQVSPEDDHAVARQFLHPDVRDEWDDDQVLVRSTVEVSVDEQDESRVVVRTDVVAQIAEDGSYTIAPDELEEVYVARPDETGQLRLASVPDGLRLSSEDAVRSFSPYDVHFLRGSAGGDLPRLVPDRVFLPVGADLADALVRRLLAGPSGALADDVSSAVTTAVPPGTELRRPVTSEDGVLTVDLTEPAADAIGEQARHLSAQLVWTLRGAGQVFTAVRLLVEGRPLPVPGVDPVQDRDAWPQYDPAQPQGGTLLLVQDRRLVALSGGLPASEATDGRLPVDLAVASPASRELALLSRTEAGDVVRIGPPRGPFPEAFARGPVGSLSWGSGDDGLWVVERGSEPQVLLLRPGLAPLSVNYTRPSGAGQIASLKVSRDGARVAAVFGLDAERQVYVGRVERPAEGDGIRLAAFRPVAPGVTDVADVAWSSSTSLVVLGALGTANRLPVRVAVDGSELEPVRTLGLDGEPEAVASAPDRPLVVSSRLGDRRVLFVEENGLFRERTGTAPAYPG